MGTLNYTVGRYARSRGGGAASIMSTTLRTSDSFTTSAAASYVEDGAGDITVGVGEVIRLYASEDAWVAFGGTVATVGGGHFLPSLTNMEFEVEDAGKVSVIDAA